MSREIGTVSQLWRYPVSSFSGEQIGQAGFSGTGMIGDRRGAYHEADTGKIVFPGIVRKWNIAPRLFSRTSPSGAIEVSLDGQCWDQIGDPGLNQKLETFCGTAVEFRAYGSQQGRDRITQRYDFKPVHLVSVQALGALRALLPGSQVDARRFRPNIVADLPGLDGRCPENRLIGNEFTIGDVRLRGIRPSGRCSFTTLQQGDLPEDHDVLRTLIQQFSKDFGIYCEVLEPGSLSQASPVRLVEAERPIVIVGAGQAGAQVANNLRDLGCRQPVQIFGDEPHVPYERPPLSKADADREPSHVLAPEVYGERDISLNLASRVERIDPDTRHVFTAGGSSYPYDRLVLALGGTARQLTTPLAASHRVHTVRTLEDAAQLRPRLAEGARLAVIGAGWLGLEIAAIGQRQGCDVTVYGRQERILNRSVPLAVASFVEARHRSEGVAFRLGAAPEIGAEGEELRIGSGERTEPADIVVVAIGIIPNDQVADLAGLDVDDGILVNSLGRTSDPGIYAAGDVARVQAEGSKPSYRIESWHNANDQAMAVARSLMYLPPEPAPVPRFWSTQYDMTIQIVGLPDPAASPVHSEDGIAPLWDFGSFVVAINRPREIRMATARFSGAQEPDVRRKSDAAKPVPRPRPAKRERIGKKTDFQAGSLTRVEVAGAGAVLVACIDGRHFAVDDMCPHAAASLSEGFVENGRIVCPVHFAEFDLDTGQPFNAPNGCGRLRCYDIEAAGNDLFICF